MTKEQLTIFNKNMNFIGFKNIKNIVAISKLATNWDSIKAMFPYAVKSNYVESSTDMIDYVTIYLGDFEMRVSYDWLNAPYETESEWKNE